MKSRAHGLLRRRIVHTLFFSISFLFCCSFYYWNLLIKCFLQTFCDRAWRSVPNGMLVYCSSSITAVVNI